jgi:flavin-dependent dehydrogenase
MVIAADGRRSRIALPLGLTRQPAAPRRWAIGAYFEGVEGVGGPGTFGEMHVRRGRYFGLAPVPSGLTNVCVVVPRIAALADPRQLLLDTVATDAAVRDRFRVARLATDPVVVGPLAVDVRAAGMPGVLLAGDAGGFIDPLTGDGLRFAVRGAELAANAALAALGGRAARPYEILARTRRHEFSSKWRFNRAVRRLVGGDATVTLAAMTANAAPWFLRRAIAFAGDVPT